MESKYAKFKRMCNEAALIEVDGMRIFSYIPPPDVRPGDDVEVVFEAEWDDGEGQGFQVAVVAGAIDNATVGEDGVWHVLDDKNTKTTIQFFKAVPITD